MNLVLPFTVEIRAKASSSWTWQHVEDRLAHLRAMPDSDKVRREIDYLEKLKERRG